MKIRISKRIGYDAELIRHIEIVVEVIRTLILSSIPNNVSVVVTNCNLQAIDQDGGQIFDFLTDTPECLAGRFDGSVDGLADNTITADECPDGTNVMFFTPRTTIPAQLFLHQTELTSSQEQVIQAVPTVQNPTTN